jgi:hypothetical protein
MPQRKDYEFSKHIGALCVRANKNVHTLSANSIDGAAEDD